MILYHGSYTQTKTPKILLQEKGRDFGLGFYTTSIKEQAERWQLELQDYIQNRQKRKKKPL